MKKATLLFFFLVLSLFIYSISAHFSKGEIRGVKNTSLVKGLILPHHDLASDLINQTLQKIAQNQNFEEIVILGPNHFQKEGKNLVTTEKLGSFPLAINLITQLKKEITAVSFDENLIIEEHSITYPLINLSKYFPKAQFLPIVFTPYFQEAELDELASFLARSQNKKTLFVVSLDFSHEKTILEALNKNQESIKVIKDFDFPSLYKFKDDHLDSPVATAVFLKVMQKLEAIDFEVWFNTHSSVLLNDFKSQGTSYVIGVFR